MDSWRHLAEERIIEAQRNGLLNNLEGFGKPIIFEDDDPNWWIKQKVRKEGFNLLPPALTLARHVERQLERLMQMTCEDSVIGKVKTLNEHIRMANMKIYWGPASSVRELDVGQILDQWRAGRVNDQSSA